MEPGDEAILAEGAVDYLGFSYYMSNAVRSDVAVESDGNSGGNAHTVPNPYVKASDWGWQIDPVGAQVVDAVAVVTGVVGLEFVDGAEAVLHDKQRLYLRGPQRRRLRHREPL